MPLSSGDLIQRALTHDGAFRVITASTTQTVRGALAAQEGQGEVARQFGDLLTATVLFRHTMAPKLRVQSVLRGAGGAGTLVADSHPEGMTRGLIQLPQGARTMDCGAGALLRVMRTLPGGKLNQGVVELDAGSSVTSGFMSYMQVSEQVDTMLAVATVLHGDEVVAAGGYLVQLLPEVGRGPLMIMTARLEDYQDISREVAGAQFSAAGLLEQLLYGMPHTVVETSPIGFGCWCSELRVIAALATLPAADIHELMQDQEPLQISCDYCGKSYQVHPGSLQGLLSSS